jgi:hypothetical protein
MYVEGVSKVLIDLCPCSHCLVHTVVLAFLPQYRGKSAEDPVADSIGHIRGYGSVPGLRWEGHHDRLFRAISHNFPRRIIFTDTFVQGNFPGQVDIPRLIQGKVGGTFWSVFVP